MKRYQLVLKGDTGFIQLDEHPEGSWMRVVDHEAELQRIRQESLTWSLACECDCAACEKLFSMIKHAVPK